MADVKISALPSATTPLAGTEVLPIVQSATTDQVSVANLTAGRAVSAASLTLTTTPLSVANGGTGLTSLTAGRIPYGAGTSAFSSSNGLTFGASTWGTAANSVLQLAGTNGSYPGRGSAFTLASQDGLSNVSIANDTGSQALQFYIGTSEKMRITSTGTVNIVGAGTAGSTQAVSLNGSAPINSMVLDASGNLLVGTTTADAKFYVVNGTASKTAFRINGVSGAQALFDFNGGGANYIDADSHNFRSKAGADWVTISETLAGVGNRTVYSTAAGVLTNSSSDLTLKTNIIPVSYGLSTVMQLNPIKFNWKDTDKMGAQSEIGFGAQDMQEVVPEIVGTNGDGTLSVDYPKLTAVLAKAIQELSAKNDALEARIAAVEGIA
jgi:hypothetical protein